jgi:hypothetical protein
LTISVDQVERKLARINVKKATGPDNIPNWILKDGACLLASPVCAVFNSSLREGYVPTTWKLAYVCALPKVNPPTQLEKHIRPISLTPVLAKVMESFTCKWVMDHISEDLDPQQYGSVKESSTVHALVELTHHWQQGLDVPGKVLRVLLLDYSKAFDRIDHTILLRKLANMGVPDFLVSWFTAFLCGRQQCTKIGEAQSDWRSINAGVPQGTLFGPVGFVIHINDLKSVLPIAKYVDDGSIWEVCCRSCRDSRLQLATDQAIQWSDKNLMRANCEKTKELVVDFGRSQSTIPRISVQGTEIERVESTKLLGVIITSKLTWGEHVDAIHSKASQRLYFLTLLKRAGMPAASMLKVYTAVVRPITEYACPVWHVGLTDEQSEKLESIQRRALNIIYPDMSYRAALSQAGLPRLHQRRENLSRDFFIGILKPGHRLHHLLPEKRDSGYNLRTKNRHPLLKTRTDRYKHTLVPYGLLHWP